MCVLTRSEYLLSVYVVGVHPLLKYMSSFFPEFGRVSPDPVLPRPTVPLGGVSVLPPLGGKPSLAARIGLGSTGPSLKKTP